MDKIFADGIMFKRPREGAPEFVKGSVSIKVAEFVPFVEKHTKEGWVNLDLKESMNGKLYLQLNTWNKEAVTEKVETKSEPKKVDGVDYPEEAISPDDIPF